MSSKRSKTAAKMCHSDTFSRFAFRAVRKSAMLVISEQAARTSWPQNFDHCFSHFKIYNCSVKKRRTENCAFLYQMKDKTKLKKFFRVFSKMQYQKLKKKSCFFICNKKRPKIFDFPLTNINTPINQKSVATSSQPNQPSLREVTTSYCDFSFLCSASEGW